MKNTKIQKYKNTKIQKIQKYKNTKYKNTKKTTKKLQSAYSI